jgi:FtsZ-binding cell division protein ZapB
LKKNNSDVIALLQNQINDLKHDLSALKAESLERERQALEREERAAKERDRLFNLLENQATKTEPKPDNTSGGLFSRIFK